MSAWSRIRPADRRDRERSSLRSLSGSSARPEPSQALRIFWAVAWSMPVPLSAVRRGGGQFLVEVEFFCLLLFFRSTMKFSPEGASSFFFPSFFFTHT